MTEPKTRGCARCGDCCDPIYLTPENAAKLQERGTTADRETADFIVEHWHERPELVNGDHVYDCDMFDWQARLCTAGEKRPPVCRYYPWYRDGPTAERAAALFGHCSYLGDVPPSQRPPGARPLIPIEVVGGVHG